ncbi:MAG: enoyl-ACP reductase FabI [Hyphomicrobiaceae bacterium]|nr:enoyl-ACP reductase FabI [Hyphomicrobiaceae bacterium]
MAGLLEGKVILVVGIADERSIATGCAKAYAEAGATVVATYLNEKAQKYVEPIARRYGAELVLPLDVESDEAMASVFEAIRERYGRLDGLLHAIAFAPREDLHGRVVDTSRQGFSKALDISCHSFIRMARLAEPLMPDGGSLATVSYYGAEKVVENYGIMGPVKAALEASVRYLASELGAKRISVNALSPGPIHTRAASGIDHFDALAAAAIEHSPEHRLVGIDEVGALAAYLAAPIARGITGEIIRVDAGYHVRA